MSTELFVAIHKKDTHPTNDTIYKYVQAGAALNEKLSDVDYYDNTGDNISTFNPYYCELTVLYWGWKNSNATTKGLVHYRRLFSNSFVNESNRFFLTNEQILDDLRKYDIIVATPTYYDYKKNKESYCFGDCGLSKDLDILRDVLVQEYPDYIESFDNIMNSYTLSYFNMFIASSEIYNDYAEWLFEVLKKTEKHIDMSERKGNQKRIYGYYAERLLNVWIMKNSLKVKYYPVIKIENQKGCKYDIKCLLDRIKIFRPLQVIKDTIRKQIGV